MTSTYPRWPMAACAFVHATTSISLIRAGSALTAGLLRWLRAFAALTVSRGGARQPRLFTGGIGDRLRSAGGARYFSRSASVGMRPFGVR
jgi:hypothetical protein